MKQQCTFRLITFVFLAFSSSTFSQTANKFAKYQPVLPQVFMLGEFEQQYEQTMTSHASLLEACDNDMEAAFDKLLSMMQEMQAYAKLTGFDLNGINAWMHFFWTTNGSIEHIGFHLKPSSRNVKPEDMKNFLSGFAKQYKFPLSSAKKYSHYSSFTFPIQFTTTSQDKSTVKTGGK